MKAYYQNGKFIAGEEDFFLEGFKSFVSVDGSFRVPINVMDNNAIFFGWFKPLFENATLFRVEGDQPLTVKNGIVIEYGESVQVYEPFADWRMIALRFWEDTATLFVGRRRRFYEFKLPLKPLGNKFAKIILYPESVGAVANLTVATAGNLEENTLYWSKEQLNVARLRGYDPYNPHGKVAKARDDYDYIDEDDW